MENIQEITTNNITYASSTSAEGQGLQPLAHDMQQHTTHFVATGDVGFIPNAQHPRYSAGSFKNDIHEYLSRPYPLLTGSITNSQYGLINSYNVAMNSTLFVNSSFIGNLAGCIGSRFTLCMKLEVAAPPQSAGIFKLGFRPLSTIYGFDPINFPTAYSTMPSAEINLADSSSCVLKYPFNLDTDFLVQNTSFNYGTVGIVAYTPFEADLSAGLSSTYVLYVWFEDLELVGPGTTFNTAVTPQMASPPEFTVAGPVSKVMSLGSKISTAIGSAVPLLSSYTRPLSWVFSGIGSLASHFGWSRPNNGDMTTMGPTVGHGINNVNGIEHANDFGAYANNEVDAMPFFASKDYDEMAICALTCIPTPIAQFPLLGSSDVPSQAKWTCCVSPSTFYFQKASTGFYQASALSSTSAAALPSTIMSVAQFFEAWRGDLVFRFKFARSKFMGGKVLVGYNPLPNTAQSQMPSGRRYDFDSAVIDLRTTTSYDLKVPYTYWQDFCPTNFGTYQGTAPYNTGVVFMQILDPVVASGSTAATCWVQVEVFSECGLVFADICGTPFCLAPPTAPLVAQMGDNEEHLDALKTTCGEAILSLKQVCQRPDWRAFTTAENVSLGDGVFCTPYYASNTATAPALSWVGASNPFNMISSWFLFYRGSVVYKFLPTTNAQFTSVVWTNSYSETNSAPVSVQNRMVNIVRRPYFAYHNRNVTNWVRGAGKSINKNFLLNFGGADNASLLAVVPGDDFQFGGFVWCPPLVIVAANIAFEPALYLL